MIERNDATGSKPVYQPRGGSEQGGPSAPVGLDTGPGLPVSPAAMKTTILSLLAGAWLAPLAVAQPPAPPPPPTVPAEKGRVLVLDNLQLVEGDITRLGDQYHVKRSIGETRIPAARAL